MEAFSWILLVNGSFQLQSQSTQKAKNSWRNYNSPCRLWIEFQKALANGYGYTIWGFPLVRLLLLDSENNKVQASRHKTMFERAAPTFDNTLIVRVCEVPQTMQEKLVTSGVQCDSGVTICECVDNPSTRSTTLPPKLQAALEFLDLCRLNKIDPEISILSEPLMSSMCKELKLEPYPHVSSLNLPPEPQQMNEENIWNIRSLTDEAEGRPNAIDFLVFDDTTTDRSVRRLADLLCALSAPNCLLESVERLRSIIPHEGLFYARRLLFERRNCELYAYPQKDFQPPNVESNSAYTRMLRGAKEGYHPIDDLLTNMLERSGRAAISFNQLNSSKFEFSDSNSNKHLEDLFMRKKPDSVVPPFHVDYGTHVYFHTGTSIGPCCIFLDCGPIFCGTQSTIGPRVGVFAVSHPMAPEPNRLLHEFTAPVEIGENCSIGGKSTLLPGTRIGNNSVVAPGSVVNGDVPSNCLFAGNPARFVRKLTDVS